MNRWLDFQSAPNRSPYIVAVRGRRHKIENLEVALALLDEAGKGKLTDYHGTVWFDGDLSDDDCDREGYEELQLRVRDARDEQSEIEAMVDYAEAGWDSAREGYFAGELDLDPADVDEVVIPA